MKTVWAVIAMGLVWAEASLARPVPYLTEEQLKSQSELIVIAVPKVVRDLHEMTTFPGIVQASTGEGDKTVRAVKMEADFEILEVLKGAMPDSGKLTLDYLKEPESWNRAAPVINGPCLVSFDPTAKTAYRLCLKKGENGHYLPLTGQTDPEFSIKVWK